MSLKAHIAADGLAMMSADEFGELITYLEPGREPKDIYAVVNRNKPDVGQLRSPGSPAGGTSYGRTVFQLSIANSEEFGMTSIREGQDKVRMKRDQDDEDEREFVVSQILSQDEGTWHVEIAT
jgi:hypothetical protein